MISEDSPTWWLYIIETSGKQLYTGITTDVARRFDEHQSNSAKSAKYLKGKGPLTLLYQVPVGTRSTALKMEYQVKQLSRAQKLELINGKLKLEDCE